MNNDKILNETGKKVLEELKKQAEGLDKNKNTQSYVSAKKLFDSVITDEESHVLHQDQTLEENFKKMLGKLRSENIEFGMEIIERKKDD